MKPTQHYFLVVNIYNEQVNVQILNASIGYMIDSDRFTGSLI